MAHCYPLLATPCETILAHVENGPGIYRLRLRNERNDGFTAIGRLLALDDEGVLYIGAAEKIVSRTDVLKHAIQAAYDPFVATGKAHSCTKSMTARFKRAMAPDRLWIELTPFASRARFDWFGEEWRVLTAYFLSHGEWPPMNGLKPSDELAA